MPHRVDTNKLEPVDSDPGSGVPGDTIHGDVAPGDWDSVYLHARREAVEILLAWFVSLGWSVGYCSLRGYQQEAPLDMVLGIPSWVFWGIVLPWVVASLFTFYYSLARMKHDALDGNTLASDLDADAPSGHYQREG